MMPPRARHPGDLPRRGARRRLAGGRHRAGARRLRAARPRVGDAVQGVPREPGGRLPRHARARRRPRDRQVDHVLSRQPGPRSADRDGRDPGLRRHHRRAARPRRRPQRDGAAHRGLAAVASLALARPGRATVGIIGCGLHGAWTARCLAAAGFGPGVVPRPAIPTPPSARRRARLAAGAARGGGGAGRRRASRPAASPSSARASCGPARTSTRSARTDQVRLR